MQDFNILDADVKNGDEKEIDIISIKEIPFWSENPNILFNKEYILEFFPTDDMSYSQKLNAISRTIILLTIISYAYSQQIRIVIIGIITMAAIYFLHLYRTQERKKLENFENPALEVLKDAKFDTTGIFDIPTSSNPFSNVLLPDIDFNPDKKPAPPTSSENTKTAILESAKQLVAESNPGQLDIVDKLFTDLGDKLVFEQSMQQFVSNPATTIPNDQTAFAEFCYGNMISCKEGNEFACARNLDRYTN
uniref:Minor capsid protein P9 transmembrane helices domain-containing protein n=1 Tax=viral metagenome TaxID=1070528 RepID=A0A6C0HYS1_9ZZZZ